MSPAFTHQGASGQTYQFFLIDMADPKRLPQHSGVFVFARLGPDPLFIGEGANLNQRMNAVWPTASADSELHGITVAWILLEDDAEERARIVGDLARIYRPRLSHPK